MNDEQHLKLQGQPQEASGSESTAALLGRTVVAVRRLQPGEVAELDRPERITVIELDDGTLIAGSLDEHFGRLGWVWARDTKSKAWEMVVSPKEAA